MERMDAISIFRAAVAAVQPVQLLQQQLTVNEDVLVICGEVIERHLFDHVYVIGAGKAAAAMAVATETILGGLLKAGVVVTKYGHSLPTHKIRIVEAAHPVPDANSVRAVEQTLHLLERATSKDIIICLISGGASALWCDVPVGARLSEVQATFDLLIRSGASIQEINTVRKHLSAIKGGQLVRHCKGARVFSLLISDVSGDDLGIIASGPTSPDPSTFEDSWRILSHYQLWPQLPAAIREHLEKGRQGILAETPKPGDPLFAQTTNRIIGNNAMALATAASQAAALGYHTHIVPRLITGHTEAEARQLVELALSWQGKRPACILQGGETTLRVTGKGKGGRNQHFVLAALQALMDQPAARHLTILSGGTDGTDGPTNAAGGVGDTRTLEKATQQTLDITAYINDHDAYHFLQQTESLVITGPTQTNVMDIMIAIVS